MLGRMCVLWTLKVGLMKPVNAQLLNWLFIGRGARSDDMISNGLHLIVYTIPTLVVHMVIFFYCQNLYWDILWHYYSSFYFTFFLLFSFCII